MESNKSDCLDTSGLKWFNGASNIPLHICMFTLDFWQLVYNDWIWIVLVAFLIAFILAFGIGANDVANSFGSSVGAKVLTLKQACILGTIFEILGAVLIGATVLDTIRKGIISIDLFPNSTAAEFMVTALSGSWMWVASFLKLPLSATHSLVGATIGFSLVAHGASGVNWKQLSYIIGSWFASPLLSGGICTLLFLFIFKIVLSKEKPLEPSLKLLPIFYSFTIARNLFSIFYKGSQCERFQSHHGPLVYSRMLLRCVHCAILSHIRLPNLVSYPSCLSANYKDLIIYRIFISRLQIGIRCLHDTFRIVYKGPISKGTCITMICVKIVWNCIQCGTTMLTDKKRWCTGLVIAMLFSHTVALPISDTNLGDKIHIFPKLTSPWSNIKNPETEYTCPNVDKKFNLTIAFRQYKCHDWEEIICMDSVSVGRVFFCIPNSTSCSKGIGWTVEAVDGQDVIVKESFCQVDYYQSEPSRCYDACKTKHERLDLIPPKYLLHSKGGNKGPAMLTCNAADGFYNPHNKTYVAFDSNLPTDFCTNVNIVNQCAKGYMPLNNGTCLDVCSQAYQELVTSSRCQALSGKDRDSENKDVPATLKPVDQGGVSTRKRNNDDMEDTSGDVNDADDTDEEVTDGAEKIQRGGIMMTVVNIVVMTVELFIISPFLVVAVLKYVTTTKEATPVKRGRATRRAPKVASPTPKNQKKTISPVKSTKRKASPVKTSPVKKSRRGTSKVAAPVAVEVKAVTPELVKPKRGAAAKKSAEVSSVDESNNSDDLRHETDQKKQSIVFKGKSMNVYITNHFNTDGTKDNLESTFRTKEEDQNYSASKKGDAKSNLGEFKKDTDDTNTQAATNCLNRLLLSCGAIIHMNKVMGSAFRVGRFYVMTSFHVLRKIVGDQTGSTYYDFSRIEHEELGVNFNESIMNPHRRRLLLKYTYHDEEYDFAILEIKNIELHENLPDPLLLWKHDIYYLFIEEVILIGYGNKKNENEKHWEICKIIEEDTLNRRHREALASLEQNAQEYKTDIPGHDKSSVDRGYHGLDNELFIKFDCFMEHGLSGGPVITKEVNSPKVIGIVKGGQPEFYYKLSERKRAAFDRKHLFEVGVKMYLIHQRMLTQDPALASEIFPKD